MIHVGLDELKCFIFDHPDCLIVELLAELSQLFSGKSLAVFGSFEGGSKDLLHIFESTDSSAHTEAEVTEPFVVESDGPVLTQELHDVGNNTSLVSAAERVEVVLMETNERPQGLKDYFLASHVGYRLN